MKKQYFAKVKPFKVGEALPNNVDGNPELSPYNGESVETGRKVCIKCGDEILKSRAKKYCSDRCRNAYGAYKWCIKHRKFKKPGVGSGGNQFGENNHRYDSGQVAYKKLLFRLGYEKICSLCKSTTMIEVHHIDVNRKNNKIENLLIVCRSCHRKIHTFQKGFEKYIKGQSAPNEN
jgi:hypothetical protein